VDGLLGRHEIPRDGDRVLVAGRALELRKDHVEAGGNLRRKS
jgi:hypothetical protein